MKKQLVWATTIAGVFGIAGAVQATEPAQLTEEQMDRVIAGAVVDTQGQNLELIATGNSINSCNNDKCYWYNAKAGKEIGKPVQGF